VFIATNTNSAYESLIFKPFDYFVTPLEPKLISEMIKRFKQKLKKNELNRKMDLFAQHQQVAVKRVFNQKKGIIVVHLNEIIYCKADLTRAVLKLKSGEDILVKTSINATLEVINNRNFVSTSRSYFINKNYLRKIDRKNFKCILYYNGQTWEVPVSKTAIGILEKLNTQAIF
jgi:two-component system LytT family response regulator